jgi:hypothetical protein
MKISIEFPDTLVEKIVEGIMANFPEASQGSALRCDGWNYKERMFGFYDTEEQKHYCLDKTKLLATFPLLFTDKWPKGCTPVPASAVWEEWDNWLCQADATDFDAFVQLVCFDKVIYG